MAGLKHTIQFIVHFLLIIIVSVGCGFMRLSGQTLDAADAPFPRVQYEVRMNIGSSNIKSVEILDAVSIAGRVCVLPEELAKVMPCGMQASGTLVTFSFKQHTISSAADASYCAVRHHETEFLELAQMAHPITLHDGRLYFPLEEFLRVLNETGVVSIEQDEAVITLNIEQSEQPASEESSAPATTTTFIAPNDDSPTNTTTSAPQTTSQSSAKFDKPTRNRYILPEDLKRRGIGNNQDTPPRLNYVSPRSTAPRGTSLQRSVQALSGVVIRKHFTPLLTSPTFFFLQTVLKKKSQSEIISASKAKQPSQNKTTASTKEPTTDNDFTSAKKKWALDVIVLDAGHGGKDGGTIGVGKTKEKDVALGITKKLGALLKKEMLGTKVVYTRTDDTFVELDRRGQIANENGGKLFVSIHCNATPKKPSKANGFEVYILRPGRNEDAVHIAEVENSVIKLEDDPKRYKPLTDEQFIVVSMAQSAFVKYSDMAAAMITAEVKKLHDIGVRGVNQAGFLVLVGASMPNMLIETGFLSNKKEEKFLKSAAGQTKLALAICRAIKAYRVRYEAQMRGVAVNSKPTVSEQTSVTKSSSKIAPIPAKKTTSTQVNKASSKKILSSTKK